MLNEPRLWGPMATPTRRASQCVPQWNFQWHWGEADKRRWNITDSLSKNQLPMTFTNSSFTKKNGQERRERGRQSLFSLRRTYKSIQNTRSLWACVGWPRMQTGVVNIFRVAGLWMERKERRRQMQTSRWQPAHWKGPVTFFAVNCLIHFQNVYLGARLSNSSKNKMHGLALRARRNVSRTASSLAPINLDNNSGP